MSARLREVQNCKPQHRTRNRNPIEQQYLMNRSVLDVTTAEKDLGVWISSDVTWTNQVYHQSNKANKLLGFIIVSSTNYGFIRRSSRYIWKSSSRRTMYLALVRPHLGYCNNQPRIRNTNRPILIHYKKSSYTSCDQHVTT